MRREVFEIEGFVRGAQPGARARRYADGAKRVLDVAGVLALAPVVLPVVGGLWVAVTLDGGPGFFGHTRVGRDGVAFSCWKLRTMCPDAEARLKAHLRANPAAAREWADCYKLRDDPRVTRLGRVLRRTSLDELPQLWNVLRGEMSLVGPRPVPRDELVEYGSASGAYLGLRPGITGLWQVLGRNGVTYPHRVRMDADYARRASLWLDLWLLWRTVGVVLRRTGV